MAFSLAEPSPTTLPNHYTHAGRGGAGNMYKPSSFSTTTTAAITPLSRATTASSTSSNLSKSSLKSTSSTSSTSAQRVSAGRGGAGNMRPKTMEEEPFSFAEEVRVQTRREQREKWTVGRGGAGNWAKRERDEGEERKGLLGRIGGVLGRA